MQVVQRFLYFFVATDFVVVGDACKVDDDCVTMNSFCDDDGF